MPRRAVRVDWLFCGVIDVLPLYTNIRVAIKTVWYKNIIVSLKCEMSSTAKNNIKKKTSTHGGTDVVVALFNFIVQ